jgi:hypothetical protein
MTTVEEALRLINTLRAKGLTDEEIVQATIELYKEMRDNKNA